MLEKGFIRNQPNVNSKHQQVVATISKAMLYLGAIVLVGSFGYLIVDGGKTDFLIGMLAPFLVAGLGLVLISRLILRSNSRLRK